MKYARFFALLRMTKQISNVVIKLMREINVKTPYDAILKWYELKPEIFKINPEEFKKNNINLDLT